jgi:hypothetical protein
MLCNPPNHGQFGTLVDEVKAARELVLAKVLVTGGL